MCYYKPMVKKGQILSTFRTYNEWFLYLVPNKRAPAAPRPGTM